MNKFIEFLKKHWKAITIILVSIILVITIICLSSSLNKTRKDLDRARTNEKALVDQIDGNQKQSRVFQATIDDLKNANDSISQSLLNTQKKLGIKDKEVAGLQKMVTELEKVDTIVFRDTIFKDPTIHIDTIIGDEWMRNHLELSYPNNICIETNVKSDKDVILTMTKETVNPPKKCFLGRWFQKKHYVMKAVVDEANPYITNEKNIFIQVVDK